MRFVLDTNVLIAAFITSGVCHEILEHVVRNHELILSDFILDEFRNKLLEKVKFEAGEVEEATALLLTCAEIVTAHPLQTRISRDPDDDNVLAAAIAAQCDCIISGDTDLVDLKEYQTYKLSAPLNFGNSRQRASSTFNSMFAEVSFINS